MLSQGRAAKGKELANNNQGGEGTQGRLRHGQTPASKIHDETLGRLNLVVRLDRINLRWQSYRVLTASAYGARRRGRGLEAGENGLRGEVGAFDMLPKRITRQKRQDR